MDTSKTNSGKAFDQTLTENANAPGIRKRAETWAEHLRTRVSNGDTGNEVEYEETDPLGNFYVREWHRLQALFTPEYRPKTFQSFAEAVRAKQIDQLDWDRWMDLKRMIEPPVQHAKNGRPKGSWELTLTYSPKWYQDDLEAQEAFRTAERKLLRTYADELEFYRSVGEFTSDGRAHLHILYRLGSGGKFTDKNLRRFYPHWNPKIKVGKGNQGGHHAVCKSVSDYHGYIQKELKTAWHDYTHNHANDTQGSPSPRGVLEGLIPEDHQSLEEHPGREVPSSPRSQGGGHHRQASYE